MKFNCLNKSVLSCLIVSSLALTSQACDSKKSKKSADYPPAAHRKDESKDQSGDQPGDQPQAENESTPIEIGKVVAAKGDVLKDEESQGFVLTKYYSFKLSKDMNLQLQKAQSNDSCGNAIASFMIFKSEGLLAGQIAGAVAINPIKDYEGAPKEVFDDTLEAGEYEMAASFSLENECKGKSFFYNFVLEESTKN